MESKRELIKGSVRPPEQKKRALSYTQAPASKDEVSVRRNNEKDIPGNLRDIFFPDEFLKVTDACVKSQSSHLERFPSHSWTHRSFNVGSRQRSNGR
jgi:hypothetical protein